LKHVIFYSGGLGSWATAKRVVAKYGKENVVLLFTDTLIEDRDLYRFLIETAGEIYGVDVTDLALETRFIPNVEDDMALRKRYLVELAELVSERIPQFAWINHEGKDVWDIFHDVRFLGNSRIAQCSHVIKQKLSRKYIESNYDPDDVTLYLGIDWTESHRTAAPRKNWAPYTVEYPMCEEPLVDKDEVKNALADLGIELPELYKLGFSHNNCGGFCVRAGQGHFANLLAQKPKLYRYHETMEEEMRQYLGKDVSILKRTRNKERQNLTLKQLREEIEKDASQVDMFDIGGCGCFVEDEREAE
jgi:3'-phosphoadenosine 5'-phosphosulfate sulfotransferase (PAPS reductase)/FAD synthetase